MIRIFRLFSKMNCPEGNTRPTCTVLASTSFAARQHAANVLAEFSWLDTNCTSIVDVTNEIPNPCFIEILDEPE